MKNASFLKSTSSLWSWKNDSVEEAFGGFSLTNSSHFTALTPIQARLKGSIGRRLYPLAYDAGIRNFCRFGVDDADVSCKQKNS